MTGHKKARAGFTLIELMVSMTVGLFVLAAAVQLTSDQSRLLGRASSRLEMHQAARLATDLLAQDLRHASVGLGYRPDGTFAGLSRGNFTVSGGASFQADDRVVTLSSGTVRTDDIGIRLAAGSIRTVASYSAATAQLCAGADLEAGEVVVLLTREGLHARTVQVSAFGPAVCRDGTCVQGCEDVTFASDSSYLSDVEATNADYTEGEMAGEFQHLVWFLVADANGRGLLQRAEVTAQNPCAAADETCGGTVADNVEFLQASVWQWDEDTQTWVDRTTAGDLTDRSRVRIDLELGVRAAHSDERDADQAVLRSELSPTVCVPGPCGRPRDKVQRYAVRSSVEIRNSGRMQIR
ncbi:MAG: prepilin-type N-terminal cleavage/methylation domain-containing protein [Myxococcales bacterium]|nr:prepilin-type N-terminal cleavage/methylation domain-containing protein [Myxococcales bacterium]MCB9645664.1 prepilin-type N-terminal cleavage/methylation domain-containing protein [Deltaproteobacteria bacterium]